MSLTETDTEVGVGWRDKVKHVESSDQLLVTKDEERVLQS